MPRDVNITLQSKPWALAKHKLPTDFSHLLLSLRYNIIVLQPNTTSRAGFSVCLVAMTTPELFTNKQLQPDLFYLAQHLLLADSACDCLQLSHHNLDSTANRQ